MQSLLSVRFGCHNLPLRFCWWLQKTKPTASSCLTVICGDFLLGNSQERPLGEGQVFMSFTQMFTQMF